MSVHMKLILDNLYKIITGIRHLILTSYCSNQMSQLEKKNGHTISYSFTITFTSVITHNNYDFFTQTNAMPWITYKNCTTPHFLIPNWNRNKDTNHHHILCEQHDEALIQHADY